MRSSFDFDLHNLKEASSTPIMKTKEESPRESFPSLLHRMLTQIDNATSDEAGLREIISWQEHGMAFQIHDKDRFTDVIMPQWFPRLKYSSWVRLVNSWGFKRVQKEGKDKGALYHSNFIRDMPELAASIEKPRRKSKFEKQRNLFHLGVRPGMPTTNSAPMLNQWSQLPSDQPQEPSKCKSAPSSTDGLCGMMINARATVAPRHPLPSPSNFSWLGNGPEELEDSWFSGVSGQDSSQQGSAEAKLLSSAALSDPLPAAADDDLEPLDVFDGLWSTVLGNDVSSTMPPNERLAFGTSNMMDQGEGGANDMEPLRIFAPGATGQPGF